LSLSRFQCLVFIGCLLCPSFFSHRATPLIYTLSLHDALPIFWAWVYQPQYGRGSPVSGSVPASPAGIRQPPTSISFGYFGISIRDRKSTRLNSSHVKISYAVFCLKKKNQYEI